MQEVRTKQKNILVGNQIKYQGEPALEIKHGKKTDYFTLDEWVKSIYGENATYQVILQK